MVVGFTSSLGLEGRSRALFWFLANPGNQVFLFLAILATIHRQCFFIFYLYYYYYYYYYYKILILIYYFKKYLKI
jgi:hypothetical protein